MKIGFLDITFLPCKRKVYKYQWTKMFVPFHVHMHIHFSKFQNVITFYLPNSLWNQLKEYRVSEKYLKNFFHVIKASSKFEYTVITYKITHDSELFFLCITFVESQSTAVWKHDERNSPFYYVYFAIEVLVRHSALWHQVHNTKKINYHQSCSGRPSACNSIFLWVIF